MLNLRVYYSETLLSSFLPSSDAPKISAVFFALSDPTRRDMIARLVESTLSIGELAENYESSLPAISKHVQVLADAEIVSIEKSGRNRMVSLQMESLSTAQIWLSTLSDDSLLFDALEAEIEKLSEM